MTQSLISGQGFSLFFAIFQVECNTEDTVHNFKKLIKNAKILANNEENPCLEINR